MSDTAQPENKLPDYVTKPLEDGLKPESISLEWRAHLKDGSFVDQAYGTPEEKQFRDLDQSQIEIFELRSLDDRLSYQIHMPSGEMNFNRFVFRHKPLDLPVQDPRVEILDRELIFYRRQREDFTPEGVIFTDRYLLGWKGRWERKRVSGQEEAIDEKIQFIAIIEDDGTFTFMNRRMLE